MKTQKTLQISIKSIPDTGKQVSLELGKEWFARWRQEDPGLGFSEAEVGGAVFLAKHRKDILIRGRLDGYLGLSCSRCLEPLSLPVAADFDLLLAPAPPGRGSEESEELSARQLDLDFYSGDTVDLETLVREQIILMVPLKPLCRENCRGLCQSCGANLNRDTCSCREKAEGAAPLARLTKLK